MAKRTFFANLALFVAFSISLFCCNSGDNSPNFGAPISSKEITPISIIFDNASKYDGKTVIVKGLIDTQDQSGYWFYVHDEKARIYVDLSDAGFSIPDLTKKGVFAEGKIEVKMNIPSLLATGVDLLE